MEWIRSNSQLQPSLRTSTTSAEETTVESCELPLKAGSGGAWASTMTGRSIISFGPNGNPTKYWPSLNLGRRFRSLKAKTQIKRTVHSPREVEQSIVSYRLRQLTRIATHRKKIL